MRLAECCQDAENRLAAIQKLLTTPEPSALERCEAELRAAAILLAPWVSSPEPARVEDRAALRTLRKSVRRVAAQLEHGTNLCSGWAQIRLAAGYSIQGKPVLAAAEPLASYEA
jgi:hypothetical protein